jgi:hypothetical protein
MILNSIYFKLNLDISLFDNKKARRGVSLIKQKISFLNFT